MLHVVHPAKPQTIKEDSSLSIILKNTLYVFHPHLRHGSKGKGKSLSSSLDILLHLLIQGIVSVRNKNF